MRSLLFGIGALTATGVVIVAACGGQVYGNPLGYVDDGGVFHSLDGAVIFGPGTACSGYDTAAFSGLAIRKSCSSDDECIQWLKPLVPLGYAYDARCQGNTTKSCIVEFVGEGPTINTGAGVYCTPGPEGDAYCAARLNQFLLGDGHAATSCIHLCQLVSPENNAPPYCEPGTDQWKCSSDQPGSLCACDDGPIASLELCVQRGDASHCEAPCTPPPDGGTSASDGSADQ